MRRSQQLPKGDSPSLVTLTRSKQLALIPGYGLIWIIGAVSIWWFLQQLQAAARNLKAKETRNRAMVEAIPDMLFRYSREGVYLDAEIKSGAPIPHGNIIGQKVTNVLPADIAETLMQAIKRAISSGEMQS
ncbi:MAG: hypothetical protein PHO01_12760 [Desulfotomaculaceae bacterium]|nr:hypothetical protein [Desulfotomaculaceae bacterium]